MKYNLSQIIHDLNDQPMNMEAIIVRLPAPITVTDIDGKDHQIKTAVAEEKPLTYRSIIVSQLSQAEPKKINTPEGTQLLLKLVGDEVDLSLAEINIILDVARESAMPVVYARLREFLNKEKED